MRQEVTTAKPPIKWTAVLFAFAANMLLVTLANSLVQALQWPPEFEVLATLVAPLLAGVLAARYARVRGGMHAFLGGLLSVLPLLLFTFDGVWQLAVFAGCFCTLGGALAEIVLRRTQPGAGQRR